MRAIGDKHVKTFCLVAFHIGSGHYACINKKKTESLQYHAAKKSRKERKTKKPRMLTCTASPTDAHATPSAYAFRAVATGATRARG